MGAPSCFLPTLRTSKAGLIVNRIVDFWNQLRCCESAGGTSWDVLEFIEREVTELLEQRSRDDIVLAERLTAKAAYLYQHGSN
jgi:hypothetical protein